MCSVCGKTFRTRNYLTKHVKALHSSKQEDSANIDSVNTQNQEHSVLSCNICKFQAEARQELDKHMKVSEILTIIFIVSNFNSILHFIEPHVSIFLSLLC